MNRNPATATFPGLYVGTVETVEDLGRIQVSIPSVFGDTNPESFTWARPCFPFGHFYMPEVGDRVWIAFEGGDPSAPVWLGIWYPEGTVPPEADVAPPVKRIIQSAKGHLVILDDSDNEEKISLLFQGDIPGITIDSTTITIKISDNSYIELSEGEIKIVNNTLVNINP